MQAQMQTQEKGKGFLSLRLCLLHKSFSVNILAFALACACVRLRALACACFTSVNLKTSPPLTPFNQMCVLLTTDSTTHPNPSMRPFKAPQKHSKRWHLTGPVSATILYTPEILHPPLSGPPKIKSNW